VFHALFPALAGRVPVKAAAERTVELAGKGTILIVDDEEIVRRAAQTALERYGYTVVTAEDGEEAIEIFRRIRDEVEIVLLDLSMPVMGGEECLERLQLLQPTIPVILSSGFDEVEAVRHFEERGLAGFIQKPYTGRQLAEKVRAALALSQRNV
jgi:DNA-binding NtrC family response regulator